jgi:hypothetical protein
MTKTTEAKWRALIEAQEKSGLTARAFAESRGITVTTMYWWRSQLRRRRPATELVPVDVVDDQGVVISGRGVGHADYELQLDGPMTLRIPGDFDESDLRRLVRALRC